jgi:hypothetical protein
MPRILQPRINPGAHLRNAEPSLVFRIYLISEATVLKDQSRFFITSQKIELTISRYRGESLASYFS